VRLRHPHLVFVGVAGLVVILDQVSKSFARAQLTVGQTVKLVPGVLNLTMTKNSGAAFGILSGRQPIFIAVSLVVVAVVLIYLWRQRPTTPLVVIALALVTGGAVGNLIDRLGPGSVTDFFEFGFFDFPVFNVADSAIFVGVGLLIVWLLTSPAPLASGGDDGEAHGAEGSETPDRGTGSS
jgi:signal peptidase II